MYENIKLVAFGRDGTLTQHKSKLFSEYAAVLDALAKRRRAIYEDVKAPFPEHTVLTVGSSSFDMAPAPLISTMLWQSTVRSVASSTAKFAMLATTTVPAATTSPSTSPI